MSESTMNLMWCEIPTSGNRYKLLRLIEEFTLNFERRTWMNGVTWVDGRKTTSATFSSISAGIFNYSSRVHTSVFPSLDFTFVRWRCEKPATMWSAWSMSKTNGIFILKLQLFLWFVISSLKNTEKKCWRELRMTCDEKRIASALFRMWEEKIDVFSRAFVHEICNVSREHARAYWVIDRHNSGCRPRQ